MRRDKIGMISPVKEAGRIPNKSFISSFDALKKRKLFEMNTKNKKFFDRRLIGYPIMARFERIFTNITASEKKKKVE